MLSIVYIFNLKNNEISNISSYNNGTNFQLNKSIDKNSSLNDNSTNLNNTDYNLVKSNNKDDEIGYFYTYNEHTDSWDMKQHNTVTYTGIVYYRTKEIAEKAFEISKKFYELLR